MIPTGLTALPDPAVPAFPSPLPPAATELDTAIALRDSLKAAEDAALQAKQAANFAWWNAMDALTAAQAEGAAINAPSADDVAYAAHQVDVARTVVGKCQQDVDFWRTEAEALKQTIDQNLQGIDVLFARLPDLRQAAYAAMDNLFAAFPDYDTPNQGNIDLADPQAAQLVKTYELARDALNQTQEAMFQDQVRNEKLQSTLDNAQQNIADAQSWLQTQTGNLDFYVNAHADAVARVEAAQANAARQAELAQALHVAEAAKDAATATWNERVAAYDHAADIVDALQAKLAAGTPSTRADCWSSSSWSAWACWVSGSTPTTTISRIPSWMKTAGPTIRAISSIHSSTSCALPSSRRMHQRCPPYPERLTLRQILPCRRRQRCQYHSRRNRQHRPI